jgi:hypothetical protein
MRPGPDIVDIARLVNPRRNMRMMRVGFVDEKIPNILMTRSIAMT